MILVLICTLFTSVAQIFYKAGAPKLEFNIIALITNYPIIIGLILYALGAAILIKALKGADLSILYPVIATSYIWVLIFSAIFFGESLNFLKILGVLVIIGGVIFMGFGSKPDEVGEAI